MSTSLQEKVIDILENSDFNSLSEEDRKKIIKYNKEQQILTLWQILNNYKDYTSPYFRKSSQNGLKIALHHTEVKLQPNCNQIAIICNKRKASGSLLVRDCQMIEKTHIGSALMVNINVSAGGQMLMHFGLALKQIGIGVFSIFHSIIKSSLGDHYQNHIRKKEAENEV